MRQVEVYMWYLKEKLQCVKNVHCPLLHCGQLECQPSHLLVYLNARSGLVGVIRIKENENKDCILCHLGGSGVLFMRNLRLELGQPGSLLTGLSSVF